MSTEKRGFPEKTRGGIVSGMDAQKDIGLRIFGASLIPIFVTGLGYIMAERAGSKRPFVWGIAAWSGLWVGGTLIKQVYDDNRKPSSQIAT